MSRLHRIVLVVTVLMLLAAMISTLEADAPTTLYRLSGPSSLYSGCIEGPCMCPISGSFMGGTFGLTLDPTQPLETYAITEIDWFTHWDGVVRDAITGSGSYTLDGETHRIQLELQVAGGDPIAIDSGFVVRGSEFPAIEISGLTDGFCFQDGVTLDAAPSAVWLEMKLPNVFELTWTVATDATSYDVVQGSLGQLRATGGAFDVSSTACVVDGVAATSAAHAAAPQPGEAIWFLVRGQPDPGYDSGGPGQTGSRDDEIAQSAYGCP